MKYRFVCGIAVASAAALVALRLWQYLWIIDVSSGFFTRFSPTIPVMYGIMGAVFVISVAAAFADKTFLIDLPSLPPRARILGLVLLLAGAANLFSSAFSTPDAFLNASRDAKTMIAVILGFAASAVLLYYGVRLITGHSLSASGRVLPLLPMAWATVRLLITFMHNATVLPISENLLTLLSLVAMAIYFLYFAFAVAGTETKLSRRCFFIFGITGFVLIAANTLGMLTAASAHAFYELEPDWYVTRVADLLTAAVMLSTALYTAFARKSIPAAQDKAAQ